MSKQKFTVIQQKNIDNIELSYNKAKEFFHCKSCIEAFLGTPLHKTITPREYGMYEASSYTFTYPGRKKADIIVIWCKRCGKAVWDSRNLISRY